jgi:uncharacterized metal-binding protein YceD (DUF177 family)
MNNNFEFSKPIDVMRLPAGGGTYALAASAEERAALAVRFALLSLDRLEAEVQLEPAAGGFSRLSARLSADLTQACVVTLEPVASHIEESFSLLYGTPDDQDEVLLDGDSETIEPLEGGIVDIGEAVAQQLSLALDPFPRAKSAEIPAVPIESGEPRLDSPFAILAKLRKGEGS